MGDDGRNSPPVGPETATPHTGVELVNRFAQPGIATTIADALGHCFEIRPKVVSGTTFVGTTRADRLAVSSRVTGRCSTGTDAITLVFFVEEVESTAAGMADALLRLVDTTIRGNERQHQRHDYDADANAVPADAYGDSFDSRGFPIRVCNISRSGLAVLADRRLEPGALLDVVFGDEAAARIRCRIQLLRVDRASYGRTRYGALITAISELDQLRLDRLCNRLRLREETPDEDHEPGPGFDPSSPDRQRGGLRRLFGRT